MSEDSGQIDTAAMERVASLTGLSVAVVDSSSQEIAVANNNSICVSLNKSGKFSTECAKYCGRAFEIVMERKRSVNYECHAGLECRAIKIGDETRPLAAIVGRTFLKSENYRRATKRAIDGDWSQYAPSEFFENILITGAPVVIDKAASSMELLVGFSTSEAVSERPIPQRKVELPTANAADEPAPITEQITNMVERFNREVGLGIEQRNPDPELKKETDPPVMEKITATGEHRTESPGGADRNVEARAWRSFFGSLLKTDYGQAAESILEFVASQFDLKALIWLDRRDNRLVRMAGFGEMKERKMRLGIAADDERLIEALRGETPFEIGERRKNGEPNRTMNLFPIGVGDEVSAAIAVLDEIGDEQKKKQIARTTLSIAPQIEILRLRSALNEGETLSSAVIRFGENLKRIDADDLWLRLTQNAAEMLSAERASLLIYDEKLEGLGVKALIGAKSSPPVGEEIGTRVARHVFAKSLPVAVADIRKTGLPPAPEDRGYKTYSFLSCPIAIDGRTVGVMNFADRSCGLAFDKSSLELFLAIAPQLAVAVDRANLKEVAGKFEQLSVTDVLTGLLNRRYMEARLAEEVKRSNRHGFPMSFMMLDVDNFKSYNDEFGHPAGDEALKIVGEVVRDTLRGADVAARFGGEEFAILLPQTTGYEAATIAERIRRNIEHAKFAHRRVTTSIGVASCSAELCVSPELISAADQALYEAKRSGRNRVLAFEEMRATAAK